MYVRAKTGFPWGGCLLLEFLSLTCQLEVEVSPTLSHGRRENFRFYLYKTANLVS